MVPFMLYETMAAELEPAKEMVVSLISSIVSSTRRSSSRKPVTVRAAKFMMMLRETFLRSEGHKMSLFLCPRTPASASCRPPARSIDRRASQRERSRTSNVDASGEEAPSQSKGVAVAYAQLGGLHR